MYEEVRRLEHYHMRGERVGNTRQTTALVNDVSGQQPGQRTGPASNLVQANAELNSPALLFG